MRNKYDFIYNALDNRKQKALFRNDKAFDKHQAPYLYLDGTEFINFSSNDYLALAQSKQLKEAAIKAIEAFGTSSSSSRLVCGSLELHHQTEKKIADWQGSEAALIFSNGFIANYSIIQAIADKDTLIVCDKFVHNSIISGALSSKATVKRYPHNDYIKMRAILEENAERFSKILCITESVFSMDGDLADLNKFVRIADEFDCITYVDDAHAIGVYGINGSGLATKDLEIDIRVGTAGKAMGGFGAYVCCSNELRTYLVNYCNGFIYSTAPSPDQVAVMAAAIDLFSSKELQNKREHISKLSRNLRSFIKLNNLRTIESDSHIIPILIGDAESCVKAQQKLYESNIILSAIRTPTVPANQARLRVSLTAAHTQEHIHQLSKRLLEVLL